MNALKMRSALRAIILHSIRGTGGMTLTPLRSMSVTTRKLAWVPICLLVLQATEVTCVTLVERRMKFGILENRTTSVLSVLTIRPTQLGFRLSPSLSFFTSHF